MSTEEPPADLAIQLASADSVEQRELIGASSRSALDEAVAGLSALRTSAAAAVLVRIDALATDKAVRKAARRELHRLQSVGITPETAPEPSPQALEAVTEPSVKDEEVQGDAWATSFDASGSRALWLLTDRPLGGAWLGTVIVNDIKGIQEVDVTESTRKRFQRDVADRVRAAGSTMVQLPSSYALALVREAVDQARVQGPLPTGYARFKEVFGEADAAPERPLAFATVSPVEARFNPAWLGDTDRLLDEPELLGWHVPVPDDLRERAMETVRSRLSGLVVATSHSGEQEMRLLNDAARTALTAEVRQGLRRRLEETAFIFLATDRAVAARMAVAAASALDDSSASLRDQPLLAWLLMAGLIRTMRNVPIAGRSAGELLARMLQDAWLNERDQEPGGGTTTPSGLILPR